MRRPIKPFYGKIAGTLCWAPLLAACVHSSIPSEPDGRGVETDDRSSAPTRSTASDDMAELRNAAVLAVSPGQGREERHIGKRVSWAGGVQSIARSNSGVCLTVLYAVSGEYGQPAWTAHPTYQTFKACTTGAYDPELVHDFTNVTIIGKIVGKTHIGMGGGGSVGPIVEIEKLYRWSDCLAGDASPVCRQGFLIPQATAGE